MIIKLEEVLWEKEEEVDSQVNLGDNKLEFIQFE